MLLPNNERKKSQTKKKKKINNEQYLNCIFKDHLITIILKHYIMLKNLCEMPICGPASHHASRIKDYIKPSLKFHSKQDSHFIYTHGAMSSY
jgi:hypothetical protein